MQRPTVAKLAGPKSSDDIPEWIAAMREAALGSLSRDELVSICRAQVQKAVGGDEKAARFVIEYLLGGLGMKGATFVQNNFSGNIEHTDARPGTSSKLRIMEQRVAAGRSAFESSDGPEVDLS